LKVWHAPAPDRRLILIRVQGLKQVAATAKLADAFPGWPIIALVDGSPDVTGLYAVSRAGAAQLLPYPPSVEDLALALDRVAVQFALRPNPSRLVVVTGAVPGCGATTLAMNLAAEFAGMFELQTALVELEPVLGRLPGYLNVAPTVSVRDLLARPDPPRVADLQAAFVPVGDRLRVLAGPYQRLDPLEAPSCRVSHLLATVRRLVTVTVVDLPATFDPVFFEALSVADQIILVGRQDVPTIHAMKLVRDAVISHQAPEPILVLNNYDPDLVTFAPYRVADVLGSPTPRTVAADPAAARKAADAGKPLSTVAPRSPMVTDIRWLAAWVLKAFGFPTREVGRRGERRTLLGWLLGS
jgi:pilus assembly protein CpaE